MTGTISVLLVEDNDVFARAITALVDFCSPKPALVTAVRDLSAAFAHLAEEEPNLIFLDLLLPDSAGLDTLRSIREKAPEAPVVILTGIEDETKAVEALKMGADDYLLKGDINARHLTRAMTYALERNRMQKLEAERMRLYEQRDDFMATLTHDLKNPLIGANRILELLAGDHNFEREEVQSLLLKLRDSNKALLAMIRNLVEVFRYERDVDTLLKQNTDLKMLVSDYLQEVHPIMEDRGIKVKSDLPTNVLPVYADRSAILHVVQNLMDNAIKFSNSGDSVEVRLWMEDDSTLLRVSDEGPGIPREEQKQLFQRFSQGRSGDPYSPGTGLGLYLCRQIIEAHSGKIWCDSEEAKGATFTVSLPAQ